jgi:gluconate 2-dehydrogenase gamma chain
MTVGSREAGDGSTLPAAGSTVPTVGSTHNDDGVSRREALKTIAVAASLPVLGSLPLHEADAQAQPATASAPVRPASLLSGPRGTASDPDLLRPKKDWKRKLLASELVTLSALCDVIIPADAKSPSASAVGVPAYINEHVSAPYDGNARDLVRIRGGLSWLNLESAKRFSKPFAKLSATEKTQICDDICFVPKAKPEFVQGARFFDLVRDLSSSAFYTTDEGMRDLGYVGNVALPKWDPPPASVLKHLGLL